MRHLRILFLSAACQILSLNLFSTHIVGGELYYRHMGGENYEVTLVVYRDCDKGVPPFDYPAYIGVFDKDGVRQTNISLYNYTVDTIPLSINDSCTLLNSSVCYEIGTYQAVVQLPDTVGELTLVYDRCCWNGSVTNISFPLESGITITTTVPDSTLAKDNSSPYFNYRTPPFLCSGFPLEFDHSATDPDGDSLSYELFTPLNCKQPISSEKAPPAPPYFPLVYSPGYDLSNVMGGVPLAIDEHTGFLTAIPSTIGQFVFGIRVNEYRNNERIAGTTRSYQLNIQPCARVTEAAFPNPIVQCGDSLVSFANKSYGASNFHWIFGDTTSNDSISSSPQPTHIYSANGTYLVTLVAISDKSHLCNDTAYGKVQLYPEMQAEFDFVDDECQNFVQFHDRTVSPSGPINDWNWYFDDLAEAHIPDPYIEFPLKEDQTSYIISMAVKNIDGCSDSISKIYSGVDRRFTIQNVGAGKNAIYPRNDSTIIFAEAEDGETYRWFPEKGLTHSNQSSTFAHPTEDVVYTVVVTDKRGCEATAKVALDVFEYLCGEDEIYIPNAFSPNGDNENDYFRVRGEGITALQFSVYNRWGEQVFHSENIGMIQDETLGWDGRHDGKLQDPGVFVYYLKARCSQQQEFIKKGNVTLLR